MDPVGFLSVDVRDLLWSDAVEESDLFRQVRQSQLLQVQSLVDCMEDETSPSDHNIHFHLDFLRDLS